MPTPLYAISELHAAAAANPPRVALILGSGMGGLAERLCDAHELPFACIPGLEASSVAGHRGCLLLGTWAGVPVLVCAGRLHYYEGHAWSRVLGLVQIAHELGVRKLLVTNAAGGIRDDLGPGSLMALTGHQDWTRRAWWQTSPNPTRTDCYAPELLDALALAATQTGTALASGVYAQVTGPSYETPTEVRALQRCGADAVGMSTAREVEAAAGLGLRCAGLSCITNRAAGLSSGPIHHDEVLETTARQQDTMARLMEAFLGTARLERAAHEVSGLGADR